MTTDHENNFSKVKFTRTNSLSEFFFIAFPSTEKRPKPR